MPARIHRKTTNQDNDREEGNLPDTDKTRSGVEGKLCDSTENEAPRRDERSGHKAENRRMILGQEILEEA